MLLETSGKFTRDVRNGYFEIYLNAFKGRKGKSLNCLEVFFSGTLFSDWMTHASQFLAIIS